MPYILPTAPANGQIISTTTDKYVWNSSRWAKSSSIYTNKLSDTIAVPGVTYNTARTILTFTIPKAGRYIINASINHGCSSTFSITNTILNGAGSVISTGRMEYTGSGYVYGHIVNLAVVTTSGSETFTLRSSPTGGTVNTTASSSLIWFEL